MKRINSRAKGARGERRAAAFLTANGMPATRAARCGVDGGDDLVCVGLKIALEVKDSMAVRPDTMAMDQALAQARDLAKANRLERHAVLWHEVRKGWRLTFCDVVCGLASVCLTIHNEAEIVAVLKANYEPSGEATNGN